MLAGRVRKNIYQVCLLHIIICNRVPSTVSRETSSMARVTDFAFQIPSSTSNPVTNDTLLTAWIDSVRSRLMTNSGYLSSRLKMAKNEEENIISSRRMSIWPLAERQLLGRMKGSMEREAKGATDVVPGTGVRRKMSDRKLLWNTMRKEHLECERGNPKWQSNRRHLS
jgi:hypothetical protein